MPKRLAVEWDGQSESYIKDEPTPSPSPPPVTPPKKARKNPSSASSGSTPTPTPTKTSSPKVMQGSSATTKKGVYMEMIFEAGLKAINRKAVQDETGLSPAQQQELVRKDKGVAKGCIGLRRWTLITSTRTARYSSAV